MTPLGRGNKIFVDSVFINLKVDSSIRDFLKELSHKRSLEEKKDISIGTLVRSAIVKTYGPFSKGGMKWTDDEIKYLMDYKHKRSLDELNEILGRSKESIRKKLKQLETLK
jgi:hypothetical protein